MLDLSLQSTLSSDHDKSHSAASMAVPGPARRWHQRPTSQPVPQGHSDLTPRLPLLGTCHLTASSLGWGGDQGMHRTPEMEEVPNMPHPSLCAPRRGSPLRPFLNGGCLEIGDTRLPARPAAWPPVPHYCAEALWDTSPLRQPCVSAQQQVPETGVCRAQAQPRTLLSGGGLFGRTGWREVVGQRALVLRGQWGPLSSSLMANATGRPAMARASAPRAGVTSAACLGGRLQ